MLSFVLAESALELVPREVWSYPAVVSDSKRRGLKVGEMLLDRSFHHSAMAKLKDSEKRGRPDLVHLTLLTVTGAPLYLDGMVKIFVHTYPGVVLEFEEKTRLPKNYLRFRGLMEEALADRPGGGLIRVKAMGMRELIRRISADIVIGLSVQGRMSSFEELGRRVSTTKASCIVVGGFPHGHFSPETVESLDELDRVHPRPLEAHVIASRTIYEIERAPGSINR